MLRNRQNSTSDEHEVKELADALGKWQPNTATGHLERARWSLETVTHLTEYEDEKANRLFTAMTFLSALVAVLFAAIIDKCPASRISMLQAAGYRFSAVSVMVVYLLFVLYFLLMGIGATMTMLAIRPTFRIPKT